jgi:DNA-binding CsgD family transcriptional regulator
MRTPGPRRLHRLDSVAWHAAVAGWLDEPSPDGLAEKLAAGLGLVVRHEGTCLLAFHPERRPEVLHHTLSAEEAAFYVDRYLAGPYLLDPLYELALAAGGPTVLRFRDRTPDRFTASEYYHRYCERTRLRDEMDFIAPTADGTALALVVGRQTRRFSRMHLGRLETVAPLVCAALARIARLARRRLASREGDPGHRRLTSFVDHFGIAVLTEREREVAQLLLRGHSAKSAARVLGISPGTVTVHRKHLYAKLGVGSQSELFRLFLEALAATDRESDADPLEGYLPGTSAHLGF